MKFKTFFLIPVIVTLLTLFSCKTKQEISSGKSATKNGLTEKEKIAFANDFYNANREKLLHNYESAADLLLECLRIDPSSPAPMYELANIYNIQGHKEKALYYSEKSALLEPKNIWYQLLYAECLQKSKKYNDAVKVYEHLIKNYPDRIDFYYSLVNALLYSNKLQEAAKLCEKIEAIVGVAEETSIQKIKIYKQLGNFDKLEKEIKNLILTFPEESKYYGMLGEFYQDAGMPAKALDIYNELLKIDPENPFVHLSFADYYRSTKEYDKSYKEIKLAFGNKNLDIDTKVKILLSYYMITETYAELKDEANELCKIIVEVHPSEAKSHAVYGDFLYRDKKLEHAREEYRKAIHLDKERYAIWEQLLVINSELNDFVAMEKESSMAMELFPNQPLIYLFNGVANIQQKNYVKAIESLTEGINFVIDNKLLLAQFYYNLGDTYNKNNNYPASDNAYEKALDNDPDNIYVLNNYSYYLSLRGEKLEKAEQMSKRSNELIPNNNSYQDTYGWILYMMGKYNDAKNWLEKSIKNGGSDNSVILEHYGDILYKLGDYEKALQFWHEANQKGEGSKWLDKKIADKKLYE